MTNNIFIAAADAKFDTEALKNYLSKINKDIKVSFIKDYHILIEEVESQKPLMVITDLWLTNNEKSSTSDYSLELIKKLLSVYDDLQIIVVERYDNISRNIDLLENGILALFPHNIDFEDLLPFVEKTLQLGEVNRLKVSSKSFKSDIDEKLIGDYHILKGSALEAIYLKAKEYAKSNDPILILGETGTGKEHLARFIHNTSNRKEKNFIPVDLNTGNDELLESRLFGHKKGSFSGATENRVGLVKTAEGGTLFFDEIGNLGLKPQSALLRLIENKEYYSVGRDELLKADIRIIAATNKTTNDLRSSSKFKNDLFQRLNKVRIKIPPLRDRTNQEKLALAEYFIKKAAGTTNIIKRLSSGAQKVIIEYEWPGNIRNFEKIITNSYFASESNIISENILNHVIKEDRDED